MLSAYILIGQVLRPQGVDGLVKVRPDTDIPERFLGLKSVYVKHGAEYEEISAADAAVRDGFVYIRLDHAADREKAEKQRDFMLYVDRAHARALAENEHFICDLIGCVAFDTKGRELGTMTDVMQPGANDVYVFRTPRGEMLVPALRSVVVSTDVENKKIIFDEKRLAEVAVFERD